MAKETAMGTPRRLAGMLLLLAMVGVLAFWIIIFVLLPTRPWTKFNTEVTRLLTSPVYGNSASWLLLFGGPVFVFMLLAALYLHTKSIASKTPKRLGNNGGRPRASLWTYPVFTRGPLGIVSVGELLGVLAFVALLTFIVASYLEVSFSRITPEQLQTYHVDLRQEKLYVAGERLGLLGYVAMAFLFFPVARGSVLLRLINMPFEHAVKYHKWIAVITMAVFVAHGGVFVGLWGSMDTLSQEITMWNRTGVNNLAGVVSLLAGILICITSLPQVRNRFFEAFFFTHQLYIVFVAFAMMHTGERAFAVVMAGVFLFALDRFLRFMQSRKSVDLLAVRNLPGGTMELVFPKHPGVEYSAASFIFLQLPGLARLQWHPFTLSSSSLSEPDRISILVKRQGAWTQDLERMVDQAVEDASSASHDQKRPSCPFGFKASIEGPYGHESSYFLKYDAIMFVAGGSGIPPFVSILKDLLHRYQNTKEQQDLPTDVILVWAVRKSEELHVLDTVSLPPRLKKSGLKLHLMAYVTREAPDVKHVMEGLAIAPQVFNSRASLDPVFPEVGRDSNLGAVVVIVASLLGFFLVWGLLGYNYIDHDENSKHPLPTWAKGLLSLFSMLLGITGFGGTAALLWSVRMHSRRYHQAPSKQPIVQLEMGYYPSGEMKSVHSPDVGLHERVLKSQDIHFGARPNLQEIFSNASDRLAGCNVGVMVCGPESMQHSVAHQCQSNSSLVGGSVAFHFHSVSFQL